MNLYVAGSVVGFAVGAQQLVFARADESQRKRAHAILGISLAAFAYGAFLADEGVPVAIDPTYANALKQANEKTDRVKELVDVFKETKGLGPDRFLPWKPSFTSAETEISGMTPQDLKESAMWGIDPKGRFFIALKGRCLGGDVFNEQGGTFFKGFFGVAEKVQTIFQRDFPGPYSDQRLSATAEGVERICNLTRETGLTDFAKIMKHLLDNDEYQTGTYSLLDGGYQNLPVNGHWILSSQKLFRFI